MKRAALFVSSCLLASATGFAQQRRPAVQYGNYVRAWHTPAPDRSVPLDDSGRAKLALVALNTHERVELTAFGARGGFSQRDLDRAAHELREPSSGNEHPIEPRVLDALYRIQTHFNAQEIRVISGYRTPASIGSPRSSNHGRGRAIDIVVPGATDEDVAKLAREMGFMGVGIYPTSGFVHVDVRDRSYFLGRFERRGREKSRARNLVGRRDARGSRRDGARRTWSRERDGRKRRRCAARRRRRERGERCAGGRGRRLMSPEVAALVAAQRVREAAELAAERGESDVASELFEKACEFGSAAKAALAAEDPARALSLAAVARDDALAERALAALVAREDPRGSARLAGVAAQLSLRGDHAWAARVHEARSDALAAASAWELAGDAVRAATLFERAGDPVAAAKTLESEIRRNPAHLECHVALGKLLVRYDKHEAAVRTLQKIPRESPLRRDALAPLAHALGALGLTQAADEASRELAALGGAPPEAPSPAPPQAEVQRRLYGRYEVVREVASTATSRVLECIDAVRGEHVAVKIFAGWEVRGTGRDALARFEREVRVLGAIDHPNVVPLRDFVADGPAMVLAWMSGGTLETMMQTPLAPARSVEIAEAVLRALGEAHRLGVLHRDVKPANVLFDDAGVARLSDFGVAHLSDLSATATAAVIGTLAYMSPEQREGKSATVQSDIYGVGAILFEMLTGERLVIGEEPKTRPSGVHRDLDARHDAAVMHMLAPSALARPADTFAARREISSLTWPKDVEHAAPRPRAQRPASERPSAARMQPDVDAAIEDREAKRSGLSFSRGFGGSVPISFDAWTGRRVERVALTPQSLVRAGAFARAGHHALQVVLRVDRDDASLWLEAPAHARLDRPLSPNEYTALLEALDSLHAHGVVHGKVDREHIALGGPNAITLLFDTAPEASATADTDFTQLRRLAHA